MTLPVIFIFLGSIFASAGCILLGADFDEPSRYITIRYNSEKDLSAETKAKIGDIVITTLMIAGLTFLISGFVLSITDKYTVRRTSEKNLIETVEHDPDSLVITPDRNGWRIIDGTDVFVIDYSGKYSKSLYILPTKKDTHTEKKDNVTYLFINQ